MGIRRVISLLLAGLAVSFLLLASGCNTTSLFYRHADWILLWQLDRQLDLTREQESFLGPRLATLLARHREEELPRYEAFLREIQSRIRRGLTTSDVQWAIARYQRLRDELFATMVRDGAALLSTVSEDQVEHLRGRFRRRDERDARVLAEDRQERLRDRAERTVGRLEDWLGSLSEDQERRIVELSLALPDALAAWLDYQRARRERFLDLLAVRADQAELRRRLELWLVEPERDATPAYRRASSSFRAAVAQMAVAIDRLATPAQRRHVLAELEDLIETIRALQEA